MITDNEHLITVLIMYGSAVGLDVVSLTASNEVIDDDHHADTSPARHSMPTTMSST